MTVAVGMDDLVVHSRMGSDAQITSESRGQTMTVSGTRVYRQVRHGDGLELDSSAFAEIADMSSDFGAKVTELTIEFWANFYDFSLTNGVASDAVDHHIFETRDEGSLTFNALIRSGAAKTFSHVQRTNPSSGSITADDTTSDIALNEIAHFAFTYNEAGIDGGSDILRLYINGVVTGSTTTTLAIINLVGALKFRTGRLAGVGGFEGEIAMDNLKIFNREKVFYEDRHITNFGAQKQLRRVA